MSRSPLIALCALASAAFAFAPAATAHDGSRAPGAIAAAPEACVDTATFVKLTFAIQYKL